MFDIVMFFIILYFILKRTNGVNIKDKTNLLFKKFIDDTLKKYNKDKRILNNKMLFKKLLMCIIFFFISFFNMCILFIYHRYFILQFLVEIIAIIITIKYVRKISIVSEIKKQILASPDDNMEYIIASIIEDANSKLFFISKGVNILLVTLSLIVPLFVFSKPHIIYEKDGDGYAVRFYTYGAFEKDSDVVIPDSYKGKPVVGIRGNVFQNLSFIENVELPVSITYIRGHAFENTGISSINLTNNLTLIGGYAFAGTNLKELNIPDSVTEIGGGVCYNCYKLSSLKISKNITEIKGNSYQYTNISSVEIPDGVTRIGGHAFHGCSNLSNVYVPNTVIEIGSSAFRDCSSLKEIILPNNVSVNERAFKNTPVNIYYN